MKRFEVAKAPAIAERLRRVIQRGRLRCQRLETKSRVFYATALKERLYADGRHR